MTPTERTATMPNAGRVVSRLPSGAWLQSIRNLAVAVLYSLAAYSYDGLCFVVSNLYPYPVALAIMSGFLLAASAVLVALHSLVRSGFGWDVLGLAGLHALKDRENIPPHRIFKSLTRWTLRKGRWWLLILGSILIGPPIITPLLLEEAQPKSTLFYLGVGTLVSVLFWVTVWSGVGLLTWRQYVIPFSRRWF